MRPRFIQVGLVLSVHQPIYEPVSVESGFHHQPDEQMSIGFEGRENHVEVIAQPFFKYHPIVFIDNRDHVVVAMQVNSSVIFPLHLFVWVVGFVFRSKSVQLFRGPF